jgi:serine/threonine protein kinase
MPLAIKKPARLPTVSRYEFGEPIGDGGTGTVYRARDRQTGGVVAIKVLRAKLAENPTQHQRLAQEFRAATQLEHPNIVRALDVGNDGHVSYLVYELIDGESLRERIDARGRLSESAALRLATQVAQALHYAHLRKVIHRDVKPDNILLLADGRAKLTDFGLAKDHNNDQYLTMDATGLGTPNYMAPEQFVDAKNVGPRSDVYSLAATLFAAVTGQTPFDAPMPVQTLIKKEQEFPSLRPLAPDLSGRVDAAIRAALRPDPAARPRSCLEFFKLLTARPAFDDGSTTDLPPSVLRSAATGTERRAWVRHELNTGAWGVIDTAVCSGGPESEELWPLVVRDLSNGGVGVRMARRFEPGTELSIEFSSRPHAPPRRFSVRVVRVVPEEAGHWVHGCAFPERLTDDELDALLKYA